MNQSEDNKIESIDKKIKEKEKLSKLSKIISSLHAMRK